MRKTVFIVVVTGCILGYGYWHSLTHAAFHIQLVFKADGKEVQKNPPQVEVDFLDAEGHRLAHGVSDEQYSYVHLIHPEVGDCHALERSATVSESGRNAWQVCFEQLSTWIATWAGKVHRVDLKTDRCTWSNIPVTVSRNNSDWMLWWVPHPHIGGIPYAYYSLYLTVAEDDCEQQTAAT
jgi:hypothetical protein